MNGEHPELARLRDTISNIADALSPSNPKNHVRMEEGVFVSVFLPMFAAASKGKYNVDLNTWINAVGSLVAVVDVVDEKGKVLFTVPPVLDTTSVKMVEGNNVSVDHIAATAKQLSRVHPVQAKIYLAEQTHRLGIIPSEAELKKSANKYAMEWNDIFKRYLGDEKSNSRQATTKVDNPPMSGMCEFEEL